MRVFALVVPHVNGSYCARANNMSSFSAMNVEIANMPVSDRTPWTKPVDKTEHRFKGSLVGSSFEQGEKVSLKNCVVADHVSIGSRAKLKDCVLMSHVVVEDDVTIQNSVLCSNVIVKERSNLNDCYVAAGVSIAPNSRIKNESIL